MNLKVKMGDDDIFNVSKKIKLLIVMILFLLFIGIIGHMIFKKVDFLNALLLTFETFAFLHTNEVYLPLRVLQIILLSVGLFVLWFALWSLLDLVLEGQLNEYLKKVGLMNKIKKLENHYIICGGGRVGSHIAELLRAKKERYIILDKDESVVSLLEKKGFVVDEVDILEEKSLIEAGIKKAKALITVLGETEKNIMITLTAKEIRPDITVYARSDRKEFANRLKSAGATFIIIPEFIAAEEIVKELSKHHPTLL